MVPSAAWIRRPPIRAMRHTTYKPRIVVRVICAFKKLVIKVRRVFKRIILTPPKIVRRVMKPWAQGPP